MVYQVGLGLTAHHVGGEESYDDPREVGQCRTEELHVVVEIGLGQGPSQPIIAHVEAHLAPPEPQPLQVLGFLQDEVQQVPLVFYLQSCPQSHLSQQCQETDLWVERLNDIKQSEESLGKLVSALY